MAARIVSKLPEGADWMYEVKFDGYRAILMKNGERVWIRSRNDKDLTVTYPSVTAAGRGRVGFGMNPEIEGRVEAAAALRHCHVRADR